MKRLAILVIMLFSIAPVIFAQQSFAGIWQIVARNGMAVAREYEMASREELTIHQWTAHGGQTQQWRFVSPRSDGALIIQNLNANQTMDIQRNRTGNGIPVQLGERRGDQHDTRWRIIPVDGEWVKIQHVQTGLNLDNRNNNLGQQLHLWQDNNSQTQHFRLIPHGDQVPQLRARPLQPPRQSMEERRRDPVFREIENIVYQIGLEIDYDYPAVGIPANFRNPNIRRELCWGYSMVLSERLQNHPLVERVEEWISTVMNHEWSLVVLKDGRELYIDATWYDGSQVGSDGFVITYPVRDPANMTFDLNEFNSQGHRFNARNLRGSPSHFALPDAQRRPVFLPRTTDRDAAGIWHITAHNGMYVNVQGHRTDDRTAIIAEPAGRVNSQWRFERQSDSSYIITNVHSNMVMDIQQNNSNAPPIEQRTRGTGLHQRWHVVDAGSGYFRLVNVLSDQALTIPWNIAAGNNQLHVMQQTLTHGQFFRLTAPASAFVPPLDPIVVSPPASIAGLYARAWPITAADTRITGVPINDIAAAVRHINANPGRYTLLIDQDVFSGFQNLNTANAHLTIIGLDGARTIQYQGGIGWPLFHINNANASLTLGNNIILRGSSTSHLDALIRVTSGSLIMQAGSKITGHTISNYLGTVLVFDRFIMEGGEISGNVSTSLDINATGGVSVSINPMTGSGGNFTMRGGTITGNFRNTNIPADVHIVNNTTFTRTGGTIGRLDNSSVNINRGTPGVVRSDFTTPGTHTFSFSENFPATVEVYMLGAGGGGQGGHSKAYQQGLGTRTEHGTGATGGGGAVTYFSFTATTPFTMNITVGSGGGGGTRHNKGVGGSWESGNPGGVGGDTTIRFGSISLTAQGGRGGGGSGAQVISGGAGGTATVRPTSGLTLAAWAANAGGNGINGRHNVNLVSENRGGAAGRLTSGTETPFGGGLGALNTVQATTGGGGRGGHGNEAGTAGGHGRVLIIVRHGN